jgi:hypothetical protein
LRKGGEDENRKKNFNPALPLLYNSLGIQSRAFAQVTLRLHGLNTIGAELAPSLAEGFLRSIGATTIQRVSFGENQVLVNGTIAGRDSGVKSKLFQIRNEMLIFPYRKTIGGCNKILKIVTSVNFCDFF